MLKSLINILEQATKEPDNLIEKSNQFFSSYHSYEKGVIPEKIDDIFFKLADDIDYYQWDPENGGIKDKKILENKLKSRILKALEEIDKI
ncbi:MAG: hypothetical protein IPM96_06890 [Ignavibacteria bacterium]|nr:hypothetical protein [Ignavibacteria bacterium]